MERMANLNKIHMNYCFTLAYNLATEVEKTTKLLYEQNKKRDFRHFIVDLGFPLTEGDVVPDDILLSMKRNTGFLKAIAQDYGSEYVKFDNEGVSQNWTKICKYISPGDDDVLIGTDPDEHPLNEGWVRAMGEVMNEGGFGLVSLIMNIQIPLLKNIPVAERFFAGYRVYLLPKGSMNWALIGLSGKFFKAIGEVPVPRQASRYGYIEGAVYDGLENTGFEWCMLADHQVRHTDYELGDPGTSRLLREWKNQIIFNIHQYGQISFEDWLVMRREGRI